MRQREDSFTATVDAAAAHARGLDRGDYVPRDYDPERGWHCGGCDEWVADDPEQREYWTMPDGRGRGRRQPCCRECAATYSPRHYGPDGAECYGGGPIQASGHGCEICDASIYICGCGCECDEGPRGELRGPHGCPEDVMIAREDGADALC